MTAVPSTFKIPRVVDALTLQKQSCRNHALQLRLCQLYVEDETFSLRHSRETSNQLWL
ncbi:unnamed protein product [Musa acuminata subsp. malaccensis]|uniref:(wild Malaysian banana) hypothetical protein n=1 Tax=Musa acuminata subsp. malaccensis TaxID=214687 RepID=A0A804IIH5_MUSAM|nr:unnamed protein product [Musa acuminata subsp. malaccensis]